MCIRDRVYTVPTSISGQTNLERAVARLEKRAGEPNDFKNVVFSGGVKQEQLEYFQERIKYIEKVLTDINYGGIDKFRNKMDEVEYILSANSGDPKPTPIPNEVIKEKYDKKDAEAVIKQLEKIINDLSA